MTAPVIRQYAGTIPDKGQAQTSFDTNVDGWLDWTTLQFAPDLVAFGAWADGVSASLIAGNLPPLAGRNLDALRVNAAGDNVEFADVTAAGWALLDDANAAAQRVTLGLGSAATKDTGTAVGNVPVLDGSGLLDPSVMPPGGAMVLIGAPVVVSSTVAFIDFTDTDAAVYEHYGCIFSGVISEGEVSILGFRTSSNGGTTFATSGYQGRYANDDVRENSLNMLSVTSYGGNAAGEAGYFGTATIFSPHDATLKTHLRSSGTVTDRTSGFLKEMEGYGQVSTAGAHNAFRFTSSSQGILSGKFQFFGILKGA